MLFRSGKIAPCDVHLWMVDYRLLNLFKYRNSEQCIHRLLVVASRLAESDDALSIYTDRHAWMGEDLLRELVYICRRLCVC